MRGPVAWMKAAAAAGAFAFLLLNACGTPAAPRPFTGALPPLSPPCRVVLYGDSRPHIAYLGVIGEFWREDPAESRRLIFRRLAEERPDLIVHSGDLVCAGSDLEDWRRFDAESEPLRAAGIPFYPALGNHEYTGDPERGLPAYFARFPRLEQRRWYPLRAGPILILVVDTNYLRLGRELRAEQDRWYAEQLQASDRDPAVRAVIVVGHHSPYTNGVTHGPDEEVQKRVVAPSKDFAKVRLFVTGHMHTYERFHVDGRIFVVSGGGGAPRMSVRTENPRLKDEFAGGRYRPFHYCLVRVEESRAVVDVMMLRDEDRTWYRGDGFTIDY